MDVRLITEAGVERCSPDRIEALLDGPGLVWIDVMYWDADTAAFLSQRLHLHERAVHDCAVRKVHTYPDQTFSFCTPPNRGSAGTSTSSRSTSSSGPTGCSPCTGR